jgi:hypothetical protein
MLPPSALATNVTGLIGCVLLAKAVCTGVANSGDGQNGS